MHKTRWDDLTFILAVAETGSLNAAARRMGVNHATVLRRIARFEESHAVQLFEHSPKGYVLYPDCRPLLERIREIGNSITSLERTIAAQHDAVAGKVRVTSTDSICQTILAPSIPKFRGLYPEVIIDLAATNLHLDLSRLDADLTVRPTKALPPELEGRRVGRMAFRVYGSVDYLARNLSANKDKHRWVGVSDVLSRSPVLLWQKNAIPENRIVFRADSFNTTAEVAVAGLGLAMLPCYLGERTAGLVRAENIADRLSNDIWIAAHPDIVNSPRIRLCIDFFASVIEQNAALLLGRES